MELSAPQAETQTLATTSRGVQLTSLAEMREWAIIVVNSGLAPKDFKTPEAVMIAIQHGAELGLLPSQSLQSIAVINGRPCVWGDAALALVSSRADFVDIREELERGDGDDNILAVCVVERSGRTPVRRTFSVADAKKAGLWGKSGPWAQYPKRMLQMRARAFAIRDAFPDALKGVGISEEVADYREAKPAQAREVKPATGIVLPDEPEQLPAPTTPEGEVIDKELEF